MPGLLRSKAATKSAANRTGWASRSVKCGSDVRHAGLVHHGFWLNMCSSEMPLSTSRIAAILNYAADIGS